MKFNHKLLKELGIGVVSLALVTTLVLNGMPFSSVHADYQSHDATAKYFKRADKSIPKSEREHDRKIGDRADASEQRYEQNLIKRDPSAAGMYADEPDNDAKTKAIIREAVIKYPQDQDKAMLKRYHVKYHRNRAKKHVARRSNHRRARDVAKRHAARKHRTKSYGNADRFTSSLKKHSKNYHDAENHESYEQNMDAIDEMPSNPSVAYGVLYDAKNGHHINKIVLAKARYWEHRDKADGAWYSPNGEPNKRYAWGRNLKNGRRNRARKHVARKHNNRKHHAKKNVRRSHRNRRGVKK